MKITTVLEALNDPNWQVIELNDRFQIVTSQRIHALNATDAVIKHEDLPLGQGGTENEEHPEVAKRRKELLDNISHGGAGFTIKLPHGAYVVMHL